jgi:serine protease AprX
MAHRLPLSQMFLGLFATACVAAAPSNTPKELFIGSLDESVDVIVQFKSATNSDTLRNLHSYRPEHSRTFHGVGSAAVSLSRRDLMLLATDPDVEYIAPDRQIRATAFSGGPDFGWMTIAGVTANYGSLPYDGTNIGIAIIDSGVNPNDDLNDAKGKSRIVYSQSFVPGDAKVGDPYGHGTHVAGIIAGNGALSSGGPPIIGSVVLHRTPR